MTDNPPPQSPKSEPLFGWKFLVVFFTPLLMMAVAAALTEWAVAAPPIANILSMASLFAMFVCALRCGDLVSRRHGDLAAGLTIFVVFGFYAVVGFAGCNFILDHTFHQRLR